MGAKCKPDFEEFEAQEVSLDAIEILDEHMPDRLQVRARLDVAISWQYSQAMKKHGMNPWPPVLVYRLPDGRWVLVDGYHRVHAARSIHKRSIKALVRDGTYTEALLAAIEANTAGLHTGKAFKEEDRYQAAELMIRNGVGEPGKGTWDWSDKGIGKQCGVGSTKVRKLRAELQDEGGIPLPDRVQKIDLKTGTPTGRTTPYRNAQSTGVPSLRKGSGRASYRAKINGKQVSLGAEEEIARRKLDEILEQRAATQVNLGCTGGFCRWLRTRLITAVADSRFSLGGIALVGDVVLCPVADDGVKTVNDAGFRAVLSQVAMPEVRRVILVGYFGSAAGLASQVITLAKQLTPPIEFMTPEEVAAEFAPREPGP